MRFFAGIAMTMLVAILSACSSTADVRPPSEPPLTDSVALCLELDDAVNRILQLQAGTPSAATDSIEAIQAAVQPLQHANTELSASGAAALERAMTYIVSAKGIEAFDSEEWHRLSSEADPVCVNAGAFPTVTRSGG